MTLGKKIYGGFGIMIVLLLMFAFYSVSEMASVTNNYEKILSQDIKQMDRAELIQKEMAMQGMFLRAYISERDNLTLSAFEEHQQLLRETVQELRASSDPNEETTLLDEIDQQIVVYNEGAKEIIGNVKAGKYLEADKLMNLAVRDASIGIEVAAQEIGDYQAEQLQQRQADSTEKAASAKSGLIISTVVDVILALLLAFFIKQSITRPIRKLVSNVSVVADGDLTQEDVVIKSKDEIRELATAFNRMKDNLRTLIGSINDNALHVTASAEELSASTEEVAQASHEMNSNMDRVAQGAQISATSAKESSFAMEETAEGVYRVAESTQVLNESAADTEKLARERGEAVSLANNQMAVIYESSRLTSELIGRLSKQTIEIENITNVITNLTEQTNLLALNAAIEAARAGEHGKGFAVVADEVRTLAEQSKASANQIVTLTAGIQADTKNVEQAVANSMLNVEEGVKVIDEAGEAFKSIIESIQAMSLQIEGISAATEEISASTEEVSASVQEIATQADEASNQTEESLAAAQGQAETIGEINSVAQDLSHQAIKLQEIIQEFKV